MPADEQVTNTASNGRVLWALTDHQSSVRDVVDSAGTLRQHKNFYSFGKVLSETHYNASGGVVTSGQAGYVDVAFAYTGRFYDKASGLQNNLHRWYDASTGRWLSEDPIGFAAGDANLNRYVGNAPTMYVDPSGLATDGLIDRESFSGGMRCTGEWPKGPKRDISAALVGEHLNDLLNEPPLFLVGIVVDFVSGPVGLAMTGKEIADDPWNPGSYLGALPGIPAGAGRIAKGVGKNADELVDAARRKYPKKAGKPENHHVTPKYMSNCPDNTTVPLDGAYHQQITNKFREKHPYGQPKPRPDELEKIKDEVYKEYPLIPFGGP